MHELQLPAEQVLQGLTQVVDATQSEDIKSNPSKHEEHTVSDEQTAQPVGQLLQFPEVKKYEVLQTRQLKLESQVWQ